jgi:ABC-type sulfate transport system substrate-binding protein
VARWNILAAWGAFLQTGKTEEEATEYLRQLFTHVPVQDKSARASLTTFTGGKGDILIGYENETIGAKQKGEQLDFVVPAQTILIENPIAVVTESAHPDKAAEFIAFLRTPEAQRVFGEKGYRSILPEVLAEFTDFAQPETLFTIDDLRAPFTTGERHGRPGAWPNHWSATSCGRSSPRCCHPSHPSPRGADRACRTAPP